AIANRRHAASTLRAAMDRDELAEDVALAARQPRLLAPELQVLRDLADRRERIDLAVVADLGPSLDDARRADAAVPADADVRSDDGVRADDRALPDPCAGIDDGGRIDVGRVEDDAQYQLRLGHLLIADIRRCLRAR